MQNQEMQWMRDLRTIPICDNKVLHLQIGRKWINGFI